MAILETSEQLLQDALFRAGEVPGASEWDSKALDYLNREYRAVCAGASEFLPEYVADWWWMRANGLLTILPTYSLGTLTVTQGSTAITFNTAPIDSLAGYYISADTHPDVFIINTHVAGAGAAVLDMGFTGISGTYAFRAAKLTYNLNANVSALLSPIKNFRENPGIMGLTPERLDTLYPLSHNSLSGVPSAFCLENEQIIRFSNGGRTDGMSMRMEYRYRPAVVDLANTAISIPLIPLQFRHVLSDMVLLYLFMDKNDDRMTAIGTSVRSTLGGMVKENRRRIVKMDLNVAKIMPRGSLGNRNRGPLRTESGLIIG